MAGYLERRSDGYYVLHVDLGAIQIDKVFMDADRNLDEISTTPDPEFYLYIPDYDK